MCALARNTEFDLADVELTQMKRRHLRQVLRIEAIVYPRPWSPSLFLGEIARRADRHYVVARYSGDVIAYGGFMTSGLESHITTIAVDPSFQGQHVGQKVMLVLMDEIVERGGQTVSLEVRKSNDSAQRLYEKFGFMPVGVRRGYYVESGEDAIVMWVGETHLQPYSDRLESIRVEMPE